MQVDALEAEKEKQSAQTDNSHWFGFSMPILPNSGHLISVKRKKKEGGGVMEAGLLVLWCSAVDGGRAFVFSLVLVWISGLVLSTCDRGHSLARELWFMSLSNSLRAFLTVEWFHCSGGRSSSLGQLWRQRRGGGGRNHGRKGGAEGGGGGCRHAWERVDIVESDALEINNKAQVTNPHVWFKVKITIMKSRKKVNTDAAPLASPAALTFRFCWVVFDTDVITYSWSLVQHAGG